MNVELLYFTPHGEELVEWAGRVCYRSHQRMNGNSAGFIRGIVARGHESVIEHWRALFRLEATDGEVLELLSSSPLLRFTRREEGFLLSGNARMLRAAQGPLAEHLKVRLRETSPTLFETDSKPDTDYSNYLRTIPRPPAFNETLNLWSLFLPPGLSTEELSIHGAATIYFKGVSRALTHQLVRHRMASYSQASQRYCGEENFEYILPPAVLEKNGREIFRQTMEALRMAYRKLKENGIRAEDARYLLPNAAASEIAVSMTFEHWDNFLSLRCDPHAQWEIREVAEKVKILLRQAKDNGKS